MKILRLHHEMAFGITDSTENEVNRNFGINKENYSYSIHTRYLSEVWDKMKCGIRDPRDQFGDLDLNVGTLVTMKLNLKRKQLVFYVDDKYVVAVFSDIKCGQDIRYKLAISLYDYLESSEHGPSIKLIEYTQSD